ncbi:MAG: hypothetical protein LBH51_07195 [Treponema sp.]|nr:hypothetical protein [Treponema sp.]
MKIPVNRAVWYLTVLMALLTTPLFGGRYDDGRIRLVLDPNLGRFSLYYMTDVAAQEYEALFGVQNPRTTVLTVSYNNRFYRLGDAGEFKITEGGTPRQPALIFESNFLRITEEFSFITTGNSLFGNGIKISFRIENKGWRRAQIGLRFLLDTSLGESAVIPFTTNLRQVEGELSLQGKIDGDRYWISGQPDELALMGSLSTDVDRIPDQVHFANRKRLDEVPWSAEVMPGWRFNNPPSVIPDSAVAYYYEPLRVTRKEPLTFYLLLGVYAGQGFAFFQPSAGLPPVPEPAPVESAEPIESPKPIESPELVEFAEPAEPPEPIESAEPRSPKWNVPPGLNPAIVRSDYEVLREIINRVNGYLESGSRMSDDELAGIEQDVVRMRSRYAGSP